MEGRVIDWGAIPRNAVKVLFSPGGFFEGMPKSGGFLEPFVFLVAMGIAAGVVQMLLKLLGLTPSVDMSVPCRLSSLCLPRWPLSVSWKPGSSALWKFMGSAESYETAYRCGSYVSVLISVTVVLDLFPLLGVATAVVLGMFFLVAASVFVHKIPT